MTKPQIKVVNAQTNDELIRDATVAEIAQIESDANQSKTEKAEAEANAKAKAALLSKLGITTEEAALLLL